MVCRGKAGVKIKQLFFFFSPDEGKLIWILQGEICGSADPSISFIFCL